MKRFFICLIILTSAACVFADSFFSHDSEHYQVFSDESAARSEAVALQMEAALDLYNRLFHFDLTTLPARLRVRIFGAKSDYDAYLREIIDAERSDFVFISYNRTERSEMVGFSRDAADFRTSLVHYGFIQYLNAFIPDPPLWIEEGMAAYLEASEYREEQATFVQQANLNWLASLQEILRQDASSAGLDVQRLIRLDKPAAEENIGVFYPLSWGLVHFLMNSPEKRFNRIIWDSISALRDDASLEENSRQVATEAFAWVGTQELETELRAYILSLKDFNTLIAEGTAAYSREMSQDAEISFREALALRSDHFLPFYYLGLISYDRGAFPEAEAYYLEARSRGVDAGLIHYALGVNAFAAGRYEEAIAFLMKAKELDPPLYGEKTDTLLKRIDYLN
jgi:tetratricopeptide (TPR) repeat protein